MKQCLRTLVLLIWRTVFTVKRRASTPLFDLHDHGGVQILTHEPMSVCSFEHNFPLLRLMRRVSTSCINCETWQCAILHKRRFSALFWLTRTSPGANFHTGGRVCMQLFTYEIMSEIIGLTLAKDCDVYSLWKIVPLRTFLTYMDVSACKFSHETTCLYTTYPIISYVWPWPTCFHAVCRLQDVFMRVFTH